MCEILWAMSYRPNVPSTMTIPSRPAPPPPLASNNVSSRHQQQHRYQQSNTIQQSHSTNAMSRYTPTTNWDDSPFEFNQNSQHQNLPYQNKKNPPPRPPPPKVGNLTPPPFLKKPGQQTSINLLSNLFGRSKTPPTNKMPNALSLSRSASTNTIPQKLPPPPQSSSASSSAFSYQTFGATTTMLPAPINPSNELISFDSPPNSPTLTQKSNSDCMSIGSFSSDSNYSPQNGGNFSQPESGFEDDFTITPSSSNNNILNKDPWEAVDPFSSPPILNSQNSQKPSHYGSTSFYAFDALSTSSQPNAVKPKPIDFDDPLHNGKTLLAPEPMLSVPTIIKPSIIGPKPKLKSNFPNIRPNYNISLNEAALALPKPTEPLPPPPPVVQKVEHSVVSNDVAEEPYGIVLYDFEAAQDGDLSLKESEKIYLFKKLNDEWFYGKNRRGCEGMFPSSYIDVKVPIKDVTTIQTNVAKQPITNNISSTAAAATITPTPTTDNLSLRKARVLYNFNAETSEDLTIMENEIVTVLYEINSEWLFGQIDQTRQGQFPANFIEFL